MANESKGKFIEVLCPRCGNKQIIFGKATTKVKCVKCDKLLVKNFGGKIRIRTLIRRVFK